MSQEFQSTQQETYGEDESETPQDEPVSTDDGLVWGRLISNGGGAPNYELVSKGAVEGATEFNIYIIGRNAALVDVLVNFDGRISGQHCRIFCQGGPHGTEVHLENLSTNGTFVRTAANPGTYVTIDSKSGPRRRLNSGDMITLLCPKRVKDAPEVLDRATYTFLLGGNLSASVSTGASRPQVKAAAAGEAAESSSEGALEYSFTSALHSDRAVSAHYELQTWNELGRGQFGVVFRAVHRQTGVVWACKQLDMRKAAFSSDVDSLMTEVRVLKGLKHPSIIVTEDVFQDATSLFIIQPLCEGGDLFDRIVDKHPGGYPEDLARDLVARLTKAVQYLHAKNIIHRDLKPENILLVGRGSDIDIKITDFGLAKRDAACKTFCGTPAYFAPEVLQRQGTVLGKGEYGKQADMWSVGVVSYVVLSGAPAFPGDDLDDKVSRAEFTPMTGKRWANKSDAAKAFVRALLVVSVKTRLTAEQAVGHPWIAGSAWLLPPPEQPKSKKRSAAAVDGGGDSDRGSVSHAGGVAAGSEEGSGGR